MDKGGLSIDAETVICQSLTGENMGGAITTGCSFAADCSQKEEEAARERWAGRFTALWARMSRLGSSIRREGRKGGALAILRYRCCFSNSFVSSAALLPGRAGPELGIRAEQTDSHLD